MKKYITLIMTLLCMHIGHVSAMGKPDLSDALTYINHFRQMNCDDEEIVIGLVQSKINVNRKLAHGYTPLMYALINDSPRITAILLATKRVNLRAKNEFNQNVLDLARELEPSQATAAFGKFLAACEQESAQEREEKAQGPEEDLVVPRMSLATARRVAQCRSGGWCTIL
ncbi:MAG: ankyrin repeat domain-containing protein [Candidatus Dependentiae bacterium]|nr:ankyrin repeat domain-containing protein [Candidatus Dependentiae bacterium]